MSLAYVPLSEKIYIKDTDRECEDILTAVFGPLPIVLNKKNNSNLQRLKTIHATYQAIIDPRKRNPFTIIIDALNTHDIIRIERITHNHEIEEKDGV